MFIQNGMLQPWLEERGLEQNTQVFNDPLELAFTDILAAACGAHRSTWFHSSSASTFLMLWQLVCDDQYAHMLMEIGRVAHQGLGPLSAYAP